ncbi:Protein BCP1 [Gigaspora margarita]|uniref:Protein BCP1 n=1 Tax=Gigaspora margarita TaxID=4874 RepID=A0A8H4B2C9_GIGMA|nr:Protein BCP1 [Gigaspora margarita]
MGKRKANKNEDPIDSEAMDVSEEDTKDSDEDVSDGEENAHLEEDIVDIDFDFFDPKPIDFHSIKNLMIQLFSADSELFNITELTELIISQPLLGTTVKIDGADSDPYAILTVLNMNEHLEKQCIKDLAKYLLDKTKQDSILNEKLDTLLKNDSTNHIGLILSERLINMPVQIVPPMYKMLQEEIQWAVDDNEPYNFEWYLVLSKTYQEVVSTLDDESSQSKKQKKKKAKSEPTLFYFHPEDEIIEQNADYQFNFNFTKQPSVSDSKRAFSNFGIAPAMKLFLFNKSKFDNLVRNLEIACK